MIYAKIQKKLKTTAKIAALLIYVDFLQEEAGMANEISVLVGRQIRACRKQNKMTLEEMSRIIGKSKSTISKYEKGEIPVDVETLYLIAKSLQIHIEYFFYSLPAIAARPQPSNACPSFFTGLSKFYSYLFDGRNNQLIRCVFDILPESNASGYKIMMYMNFNDYHHYQICENTYWGYIEHYDALTNIQLTNQDSPMENASVQILASYLSADTKWGLWNGFSTRPMMPVAAKMLFSRDRLQEDAALLKKLKVSKEDIRLLKLYNMLSVL